MGIIRFVVTFILVAMLWCSSLLAGGFENTGLGTKARGMAGAFRAIADDWTAAWYNPAGYAFIADNQIGGNAGFLHFRDELTPNYHFGGLADETGIFNDRRIYNAHAVLSMPSAGFIVRVPVWGETVFGLSAYEPFDANIRWSLFNVMRAYNDTASFKPPSEQFTNNLDVVAFQLTAAREYMDEKLSLGVGLQLLRGDLAFKNLTFRDNPMASPFSDRPFDKINEESSVDGNGWGFGLKLGALYKQSEKLRLGATLSIPSSITLKGRNNLSFVMPRIAPLSGVSLNSVAYLFASGRTINIWSDYETKLKLPMSFGAGAAYKVTERLTMALDGEYTLWSTFKGFDFSFTNFDPLQGVLDSATVRDFLTKNLSSPVDWKNTVKFALGASYDVNATVTAFGGASFDQSPAKDAKDFIPQFVDTGNKLGLNIGAMFHLQRWDLGLATSYVHSPSLTVTSLVDSNGDGTFDSFPGTYGGNTFETILSFSYRY
jgi:long-chain fatty acid transport protein